MGKYDEPILVVTRDSLFGRNNENYFEGFQPANEFDFESRILKRKKYMVRKYAERDARFKQPIGYSIIVNPLTAQVFAYQRASNDSAGTSSCNPASSEVISCGRTSALVERNWPNLIITPPISIAIARNLTAILRSRLGRVFCDWPRNPTRGRIRSQRMTLRIRRAKNTVIRR